MSIDPPYWADFLKTSVELKPAFDVRLQEEISEQNIKLAVFIVADRLIGRSRYVGHRNWYLQKGKYLINAREFAALQKLIVHCFCPRQFPSLLRVDADRAIYCVTPACSFPMYISTTLWEHQRFATSRERALYPLDFLAYPVPCLDHYQEHRKIIPWVLPGGAIDVCQGAHVCVTVESPGARARSWNGHQGSPRDEHYEELLKRMCPQATRDDIQQYILRGRRWQLVAFISRNVGCLDTEHAYSQAAHVVMVCDEEVIEQILEVSDSLGMGLRTDDAGQIARSTVFPFSFPPALCDEDYALQQSLIQSDVAFSTDAAAEQYVVAALGRHGVTLRSLVEDVTQEAFEGLAFEELVDEDDVLRDAR